MEQYKARNSAMEVLALKDERYVLQVKAEFTPLIKKLVNRPLAVFWSTQNALLHRLSPTHHPETSY